MTPEATINPDPEALEIIINKKAEEFTDADIDLLIAHFRKERANFAVSEATAKRAPRQPKTVSADLTALLDDIV